MLLLENYVYCIYFYRRFAIVGMWDRLDSSCVSSSWGELFSAVGFFSRHLAKRVLRWGGPRALLQQPP